MDTFELPTGKPGEYHYVHTNGSSMVVPILGDGKVLLVNQYRCLLGRESLEFPCGSLKDGFTHRKAARQETGGGDRLYRAWGIAKWAAKSKGSAGGKGRVR